MRKYIFQVVWDELDKEFEKEKKKILQTKTTCQKCKKEFIPRRLDIFFPDNSLIEKELDELKELPRYHVEQALIKKGKDQYILNHKNPIIEEILQNFHKTPYQILCRSCLHDAQVDLMWEKIEDPKTSLRQLRKTLRTILTQGSKAEILRLNNLLSPNISNRMRKIPPHVRKIWIIFSYLAKKFYQHHLLKDQVIIWLKSWIPLLNEGNFIETEIGNSIAISILKIDDPSFNEPFFKELFNGERDLFQFFREIEDTELNSGLCPVLIKRAVEFEKNLDSKNISEEDHLKRIKQCKVSAVLQAIVTSHNVHNIKQLMIYINEFPEQFQRIILKELFLIGDIPKIFKLIQDYTNIIKSNTIIDINTNSDNTSVQDQTAKSNTEEVNNESDLILPTLSSPIRNFFLQNAEKLSKKVAEQEERDNNLIEKRILDEKKIRNLHRDWKKKKGPSPYRMSQISQELITEKYNPVIEQHITKYREDLLQFFNNHSRSLVAFDIEEWNRRVYCIMGIEIHSNLDFSVKLIAVDDIYPINRSHDRLIRKMRTWLQSLPISQVISHGTNVTEATIIKEGGHFQINTQDILHAAKSYNIHYAHILQGEGLKHFEKSINFKRYGCPVLKHGISGRIFFDLSEVSLDCLLNKKSAPECLICGKEQDVLLYCLEDAVSSLLIFVIYANQEPELCQKLGFDVLK
ncbi:MAG: hypothetical protein ACTSVL_02855 [Promethearchaeota archaeon]